MKIVSKNPQPYQKISSGLALLALVSMLVIPGVTRANDNDLTTGIKADMKLMAQRMKSLEQERKNLEKDLKNEKKNARDNNNEEDNKPTQIPCILVAADQMLTTGFMVAHPNNTIVLACESLPRGIAQRLLGRPLPDTIAPVLSSITTVSTNTRAVVSWTTKEKATGTVFYSTLTPLNATATSTKVVTHANLKNRHKLELTGLTASTTYYLMVESKDAAENTVRSAQMSFTTKANPDVTLPVISGVVSSAITTNGATITWTTSEPATSLVLSSTKSPINSDKKDILRTTDTTLVTNHSMRLTGLNAATTYRFVVESSDASNNKAQSTEASFTTGPAPADTTAPVISGITYNVGSSVVILQWNTNEKATSKLYVSTINPLDSNAASTLSTSTTVLVHAHTVAMTGLSANTTYYAVIESKDAAGNTARSAQITFMTIQ